MHTAIIVVVVVLLVVLVLVFMSGATRKTTPQPMSPTDRQLLIAQRDWYIAEAAHALAQGRPESAGMYKLMAESCEDALVEG